MTDEDWEAEAAQLRLRLTSVADEAVAIARQCFRDGEKAGRRYQHQQDVEFLTEYFSWLCLTQAWDKAGTVWQAFRNLMSEGE